MCGIAAIARRPSLSPTDASRMVRMLDLLAHRGPDGRGSHSAPFAVIGATRLAIEDPKLGAQPMRDAATGITVAFNGEIYNHDELRRVLEGRGHVFFTDCDTEVVLRGFVEWGTGLFTRLDGIFGIVASDEKSQTLVMARDRMGVKPLYFATDADSISIASELRALAVTWEGELAWDPTGAREYLSLGYTLSPNTVLSGIRQLEEGHYATWCAGRVEDHTYFDLREVALARDAVSATECEQIVGDAVRRQSKSDSPLGVFLSGGIDSTVVASFVNELLPGAPALTMDVSRRGYSEASRAAKTRAGFTLQGQDSRFDERDWVENFSDYAWRSDAPLGDSSFVPTLQLSRAARRFAKVMLSGDGGDELFLGYPTYQADWARLWIWRAGNRGAQALSRGLSQLRPRPGKLTFSYRARAFGNSVARPAAEAHCGWRELTDDSVLAPAIRRDGKSPAETFRRLFDSTKGADFLNRMSYVDCKTWLANDILVKTDRASMAEGLEVRVPLLDAKVVQFAFSLPQAQKWNALCAKRPLKRLLARRVPSYPKFAAKKGFSVPTAELLRSGLGACLSKSRASESLAPLLAQGAWSRMLCEHRQGISDHGHFLWSAAVLGEWWSRLEAERAR